MRKPSKNSKPIAKAPEENLSREPRVDSTLTKGLLLLETLSSVSSGKGVSELARELGLTKSNTFRLLQTLTTLGYVQHGTDKLYSATLKTWRVGRRVIDNLNLRELARDEMRRIADATHETIYLAVPENLSVIYIDMIESLRPIRTWNRIGGSAPIHCVGTGKAIIAANYSSLRGVLKSGLTKYTDRTITTLSALESDIELTKRNGYAFDTGEFREGVVGTGAAICLPNGTAIAAIGVSVVEVNLPEHGRDKIGRLVKEAAARISARLAKH
ncbi:MAG TPA: IclR family transcriptional regulator [Xanthobacteraceae bacterium]|jgi:DNA-binding IclR family transcriptional regulator|nr:IclR family transcriptional regulator [Xanthobacteraceae bacterium]